MGHILTLTRSVIPSGPRIPLCSSVILGCDTHYSTKECPNLIDSHHFKSSTGTQPFFPLMICNQTFSIFFTLNHLLYSSGFYHVLLDELCSSSLYLFLIFSFILFYKGRKTTKYAVALKISTGGSEEDCLLLTCQHRIPNWMPCCD